ncbi:helicase RepA family protein [Luteimonas sp. MJ246]|uniref:helicase RepA family protein n=1 Tax=Luteimonas sp. MJ174 TaxID=3129237 RepID=UPI0031BA532C
MSVSLASPQNLLAPADWPTTDLALHLTTDPPEIDTVLPGFMVGTVGGLFAQGGVGKSFLALQASLSVACELPAADTLKLDLKRHGRVAYFSLEDPDPALWVRTRAIGTRIPQEAHPRLIQQMRVFGLAGHSVDIGSQGVIDQFCRAAEGCRLVVIDTFSRVHRLEENSNRDMAKVVGDLEQIARKTGAAVLYVHHVGKGSEGIPSRSARGASALMDNARWCARLDVMDGDDCEAGTTTVHPAVAGDTSELLLLNVLKSSYGPIPLRNRRYKRATDGVLEPIDSVRSPKASSPRGKGRMRGFVPRTTGTSDEF